MFGTLKYNLLHGWSLMRWIRLGLSAVVIFEAVNNHDWMFGVLGGILALQSLVNVGCCSGAACYSGKLSDPAGDEKIVYEEIK